MATPSTARIVIAPDSFKSSLSAAEVAAALVEGWRSVRPHDELIMLPQADGGEGTAAAVASARPDGQWQETTVTGPDGRSTSARWFRYAHDHAVADMAEAAGLPLMARPDAGAATSRGVGELIAAIADAGITELDLGLGGSACTDGGAGALAALGYAVLDEAGRAVADGGDGLARAARLVRATPPALRLTLVTDVTAPLCGPTGAAAVFGPQKGAGPDDVVRLDAALARWAELLGGDPTAPGSGAAGGLGYGLAVGLGARIVDGADWVARAVGLPGQLAGADLLITGEGRFDATSLLGKVVGHALGLASAAGVGVQIVAGQVDRTVVLPRPDGPEPIALTDLAEGTAAALAQPHRWLVAAGALAARRFSG